MAHQEQGPNGAAQHRVVDDGQEASAEGQAGQNAREQRLEQRDVAMPPVTAPGWSTTALPAARAACASASGAAGPSTSATSSGSIETIAGVMKK